MIYDGSFMVGSKIDRSKLINRAIDKSDSSLIDPTRAGEGDETDTDLSQLYWVAQTWKSAKWASGLGDPK